MVPAGDCIRGNGYVGDFFDAAVADCMNRPHCIASDKAWSVPVSSRIWIEVAVDC
jgi:hypothetical protein